ncbi:MAG: response regulator [PVC group bacterium]
MALKHRPKILLVDDRPEALQLLTTLLPSQEYEHICAENGRDGIEKARLVQPDLILLDVRLPDLDGFEVCRRLRQEPGLAEIPVILITAFDEPEARLKGIESGADDFITKPFDRAELLARIRSITRLNRYRALLAERERFQWVVDQSDDGFLVLNANDDILSANPQARLFLSLPAGATLPGKTTFMEAAKREYRFEPAAAWGGWPNAAGGPSPGRYLIRPQTAVSRAFWLEVKTLKQFTGETSNLIIRLRDVTEQKKSICRIRSFEASISQKLRNRLLGTVSIINTLAGQDIDFHGDEFRELFGDIVDNARLLETELIDILRYLESPGLLYSDTGFDFKQLGTVLEQISEGLGIKTPEIAGQEDLGDTQTSVSGLAMESILGELLQNSKKFHPARLPEISITIDRPEARFVRMKLADNGLTLSPEQINRAWVPYYQGDDSRRGEIEGMGLGLPMIASFIWHWGGSCRLYNRADGPGVVVELLLPINDKQ